MKFHKFVMGAGLALSLSVSGSVALADPDRPWMDWDLKGELINIGYGGSFSAAEFEFCWDPFSELTGVEIKEIPWTGDIYEQVRTQVEMGRVEIDQYSVFASNYETYAACCLEEIDYSIIPQETLDGMLPEHKLKYAIAYAEVPMVLAYSLDAFPNGGPQPKNWVDFWDVEKFPGGRAMVGWTAMENMEAALLADGVSREDMYPIDFERGFKKLAEIKPHIVNWWNSGTESQRLLTSGEATMVLMSNSRIENLLDEGFNVAYTMQDALTHTDYLAVPKGAPNRDASMASIAYRFEPEVGAGIGEAWRQPIPSLAVFEAADPEKAKVWSTSRINVPERGGVPNDIVFRYDIYFWYQPSPDDPSRTIHDVINDRFQEFIAQ